VRAWLALCLVCGVARADELADLRARARAATVPAERAAAWGELGDALWRASCPLAERDGVCTRVVPYAPGAPGAPTRCGPADMDRLVAVPRDVGRVKAALDAYEQAARADPVTAVHYQQLGHLRAIDYMIEHEPALAVPADHSIVPEREWLYDAEWRVRRLVRDYRRHMTASDDATTVAVAERIGRLYDQLATQVLAVPLPADLYTGPAPGDALDAFCDELTEFAEAQTTNARISYQNCLNRAHALAVFDDAALACERALERLDPDHYPHAGELLHVQPPAPIVAPEAPAPTSSSTR